MKNLVALAVIIVVMAQYSAFAQGTDTIHAGMQLTSQDGHSIGTIYKVADDGSVMLIVDRRMVTLQPSIVHVEGKSVTASLTKLEIYHLRQPGG